MRISDWSSDVCSSDLIRFDHVDDALAQVNNSIYGLGGSVWSADSDRAIAIARRIESGTVWINHHADLRPNVPFGGAKQSGIGTELGTDGLLEFSQTSVIRSEEHTSELQSLMRNSYAVFCLKKKNKKRTI